MKIGDLELPDKCPDHCKELNPYPDMSSLCFRCPIFNCAGEVQLLKPIDFNPELAKLYFDYFSCLEQGERNA